MKTAKTKRAKRKAPPETVSAAVYAPRSTNRRRTRKEMEVIRLALYETLAGYNPMTVRQTFYQLESKGVVEKSEREYKGTVIRLLTEMRVSGEIPFGWIADNTRWMRKPRTFSSLDAALQNTARTYRRALWDEQDVYVEIWCEKDAIAGVLLRVSSYMLTSDNLRSPAQRKVVNANCSNVGHLRGNRLPELDAK